MYASNVNVAYDLLGGRLRPLLGLEARHVQVADYSGRMINGVPEEPTRLHEDATSGTVVGVHGGWDNAFRAGLTYDTRDFEPNPESGLMLEMAGRYVSRALRLGLSPTCRRRPRRGITTTRYAASRTRSSSPGGGLIPRSSAPCPSIRLAVLPHEARATCSDSAAFRRCAAIPTNRFIGKSGMVANAELRWTFSEKTPWHQHLDFILHPSSMSGAASASLPTPRCAAGK